MAEGLHLAEIVRKTVQVNAKLYKGWIDLSLDYWRGVAEIFGGPQLASVATPVSDAGLGSGMVVLEEEAGATARGAFLLTNDLERGVSCELVASSLVDAEGLPARAVVSFEPARLELAPGEQRVVQVMIPVDASLAPGVGYAGELSIRGMEGFSVPIVLRRRHRIEEGANESNAAASETLGGVSAPPQAARGRSASASTGKATTRPQRAARQKN